MSLRSILFPFFKHSSPPQHFSDIKLNDYDSAMVQSQYFDVVDEAVRIRGKDRKAFDSLKERAGVLIQDTHYHGFLNESHSMMERAKAVGESLPQPDEEIIPVIYALIFRSRMPPAK